MLVPLFFERNKIRIIRHRLVIGKKLKSLNHGCETVVSEMKFFSSVSCFLVTNTTSTIVSQNIEGS